MWMKKLALLLVALGLCTGCFWKKPKQKFYTIFRASAIEGMNLQGKETSIRGFEDDVLYEIARNKGFRLKINTVEHAKTIDLLDMTGADGAVGVVDINLQNPKMYTLSDPLFSFGPVVILRANETYTNLDSLKNKIIGFERAYAGVFENPEDLSFIFKPYDQMTYAMEDLVNGKIDAIIMDSIRANTLISSFYANKLKVASGPLKVTSLSVIVKVGKDAELITLVNDGLKDLKAHGTYKKMLEYWGLPLTNSEK